MRAKRANIPVPGAARPEPQADTRPLFRLTAIAVDGASFIPGDVIAETYRSYLGKTVSQADLVAIAGKVSDLYREAGYHLSRAIVPPQDIKNGRIRLKVIEGRIAEIVLKGEGAEHFGVRPLLDIVAAEVPSRLQTLERQLLLVNDRPGVRITDTALEEIGVATGRFRLIVHLETWGIHTAFGLDNGGRPAIGPLQAYWASAFNSYFAKGDTLGLNLSTIPDATRELRFGRVFYEAPIGVDGARLGAMALYNEVWPGDERRNLRDHTQTEAYAFKASIVPLLTRKSSLSLTATAGIGNISESDLTGSIYRDRIRTLALTADYYLSDDLGGRNYLTVTARQGIDILGASHKGDAMLSRADGSGNFSLLDFAFTRYQSLSDIWSIKLSAAGQLASTALLASQEFYLSWVPFGRGFYSGEFSGDNGIAGSAELQFNQTLKHEFFKGYQIYGFFGRGVVWNIRAGKDDALSFSSVGAGVRLSLADELHAGVAVAVPLPDGSIANQSHDPRIFFSLSKSFKLCPERAQMRCL